MEYEKLSDDRLGEPSVALQARVEAARERQRQRFGGGWAAVQCGHGAGLACSDEIETAHPSALLRTGVAEAIPYRLRRQGWVCSSGTWSSGTC